MGDELGRHWNLSKHEHHGKAPIPVITVHERFLQAYLSGPDAGVRQGILFKWSLKAGVTL